MAEQEQQGNVRQEYSLARIGLDMDNSVNQIAKGKLSYALNASVENFDDSSVNYQNEPGNEQCSTDGVFFPENFHLIGKHFIPEKNKHIFFLVNPETGDSQIGFMENNDCVYKIVQSFIPSTGETVYADSKCLNFNIKHPIHKVVHKISNCSTEIYWTDGYNPRRYMDIENVPYITVYGEDICTPTISPVLDCNKLKVQPNFNIPNLTIKDIIVGGENKSGVYQFAIQYCSSAGDGYTSFYSITNPTSIANTNITTLSYDYSVGKSIVIDITNLDVSGYFNYFNLAVIKTINDITSVELVGTYFIDNNSKTITYTGQNQTQIILTISDIFEKHPYYEIAQDLTVVRDILVWDDLTSIDRVNYQKIANKVELQWQSYKMPETENYGTNVNSNSLRGYLRDEVYPFEIVFLLDNGKQTDGFHIPGRKITYEEQILPDVPNTNPDFIGTGTSAPYWKIYNTAFVIGDAVDYNIGNATPYKYGEFAYWESTETYPCDTAVWGELAGLPIRHHKFPDVLVSPIFDSAVPNIVADKYTVEMQNSRSVYPLGVKVNSDQIHHLINISDLTDEQKASIVGFKIVRGDRSVNKSIVGKGILRNVGKYTRDSPDSLNPTYYYYPNYPYNDLNTDPFLLSKSNSYISQGVPYSFVAIADGEVTYTDIYTNSLKTLQFTNGSFVSFLSLTYPIYQSSQVDLFNAWTYYTYTVTTVGPTTFLYSSPLSNGDQFITIDGTQLVSAIRPPDYYSGSTTYTITKNVETSPLVTVPELNGFSSDESKYRHVFNSPETSFGQPILGNVLKLESVLYGAGNAHFVQVKKHSNYKLLTQKAQRDALSSSYDIAMMTGTLDAAAMFTTYQAYLQVYINGITRKNYTYSFNSIANYDYSADIPNGDVDSIADNIGIKQRQLDLQQYLIPGIQSVGDTYNLNNYNRESSVYLKTTSSKPALPYPNKTKTLVNQFNESFITDTSRFTISEKNKCSSPEENESIDVVSYYGSLKIINSGQWGQMYSYNTIDTGFQRIFSDVTANRADVVFGGDTFICRFAFKTKLPFFIDNRVGAPDDSDIFYDEIGNIAFPQYWYSSRSVLYDYQAGSQTMKNMISVKAHNLDCPNNTLLTTTSTTTFLNTAATLSPLDYSYDGKMYLFAYGIPYFYCESSINVDLRQAFNNAEGDFYPHVSTGIPDNWLQESVVPIAFDNTYYYNVTYSKQNKENIFTHLPTDWKKDLCYTNYPFRAIYSDTQDDTPNPRVNNWLNYMPVSYFDFPQSYGKLTSLDGIQNKAILARFENKSLLYNTMLTINTSNPQAAYLGNPTLFKSSPPIDFAETDLGYVGSQNKMLLKIPQGQITIDAKRGQVFLIEGNQAVDISAFGTGLNKFFTDHLAFEILRYFPETNIDNHFNGVGLHGVYDSKYDRVIISKLDYIPQIDQIGKIKYDVETQEYYVENTYGSLVLRKVVDLTDINYFCNKSWTLSFNMNTKSWISFHSYIPNFYIAENNFFYSGLNEGCDLEAIAINEIPTPTTTTTTTTIIDCSLNGNAVSYLENALKILFNNIDVVNSTYGDSSDVNTWNTLFNLPVNGNPFTNVIVNGNEVSLFGGSNITVKINVFGVLKYDVLSVDDQIGCIVYGNDYAFYECINCAYFNFPEMISTNDSGPGGCFGLCTGATQILLPKLTTAYSYSFNSCYSIDKFSFPLLSSIGAYCFQGCSGVASIQIPSCTNLGGTVGNNNVFFGISGNLIGLKIPASLMTCDSGNPDGDIIELTANNSVIIITV